MSDLVRFPTGTIYRRIALVGASFVCTSVIVACELQYGITRKRSERLQLNLERILTRLEVLPFNNGAHIHYGNIRTALEAAGTPISANDLFIAAHAASLGLILVTHNVREFGRVPGLKIEDWLA